VQITKTGILLFIAVLNGSCHAAELLNGLPFHLKSVLSNLHLTKAQLPPGHVITSIGT